MLMSLGAVFVISLGGLVRDWVECRPSANVEFSGRQAKFDDSDALISKQPTLTLDNSGTDSSLKNIRSWRTNNLHRNTRESAAKFDPSMKTVSSDYELELKNASANVLPESLIRKIVSVLGKRPTPATITEPNKQLFGGRLPPFIERIIQRIQNYFSVYNPPEYFDSNRPPPTTAAVQHSGITLICSNTTTGSVSCSETDSSEEQPDEENEPGETLEVCDGGQEENSADVVSSPQDEYNVVVTHTIVQDSSLNLYSPPAQAPTPVPFVNINTASMSESADSTQMFSNVVVILEPTAGQYSPPPLDNPDKNKFYVYVNPTSANKNQPSPPQRLKTWNDESASATAKGETESSTSTDTDQISNFRPFANTTYTVIIRGDKLQEYSNNLQTADNSLNPEIAVYVRNSTTKKLKKCKLPLQLGQDCDQGAAALTSRSVPISSDSSNEADGADQTKATKTNTNENSNKVPNINLMLVPPNDQPSKSKNKSCASKNKITKNPQFEYYVLKPDNGSLNKGKTEEDKEKPTFFLQKTSIGAANISQTYLPPLSSSTLMLPNDQQNSERETETGTEVTSSDDAT